MRQILLSPVILRLAEESSFGTYKLHWSVPFQDPSPTAQDDNGVVLGAIADEQCSSLRFVR